MGFAALALLAGPYVMGEQYSVLLMRSMIIASAEKLASPARVGNLKHLIMA
jgi:hypothetical protein